jgi:DNA-binding MarR family transcriptional regulator
MGHPLTDRSPDCGTAKCDMASRVTGLINRLGRTLHCLQFAEGLNPAQWEALRYFGRANRYSRTPSALADYLGTTKGTVSQTIKALESKGLVIRVPHTRDRRAVLLETTPAGNAALDRDPMKRIEYLAGDLVDELPAARDFLQRLVVGLHDGDTAGGFGVCEECTHFCKNATEVNRAGPHRCGLTGDPLSDRDSTKICVNHHCGRS